MLAPKVIRLTPEVQPGLSELERSATSPASTLAPTRLNEVGTVDVSADPRVVQNDPRRVAVSHISAPTTALRVRTPEVLEKVEDAPDPVAVGRGRTDERYVYEPNRNAPVSNRVHHYYRPWHTGYNVHPYYRYQHVTSVVWYPGYGWVDPWGPTWAPPARSGWVWAPGYYQFGYYHPGYWVPRRHLAPRMGYVWSNGFWQQNNVYVDGYWRAEERTDGDWKWVEGYYLEDGGYVSGHWRPTANGPEGYGWEPGFWNGDDYVDGFWRPDYRRGFTWQSAYYDADSIYHAGFWLPLQQEGGFTWVPGWFDGEAWVAGYWVNNAEFDKEVRDIDVGDGVGDGEVIDNHGGDEVADAVPSGTAADDDARNKPLGLPVSFE